MERKSKYDDLYAKMVEEGHDEQLANSYVLYKMGYDKGYERGMNKGILITIILFVIAFMLVEVLL